MKQMPVLSGLSNTGRPACRARSRTSALSSSPSGISVAAELLGVDRVQEIALVLGARRAP